MKCMYAGLEAVHKTNIKGYTVGIILKRTESKLILLFKNVGHNKRIHDFVRYILLFMVVSIYIGSYVAFNID